MQMKDIDNVVLGSFELADDYFNPGKWIIPQVGAVGTTGGVVAATGFNLAARKRLLSPELPFPRSVFGSA